jgi:hypothetical protein
MCKKVCHEQKRMGGGAPSLQQLGEIGEIEPKYPTGPDQDWVL